MFFASFIPRYISNKTVLMAYWILAGMRVPRPVREKNHKQNLEQLPTLDGKIWSDPNVCIENQQQWSDIRFGSGKHSSMSYSGCEIIAAFNAQKRLKGYGTPEEMADLIRYFEAGGAALWGEFGTSPLSLVKYFQKCSHDVLLSYGEENTMEAIERESQVMIATVYNDKQDITRQIHTVCITREPGQGYVLHNAYFVNKEGIYTASPAYATLQEAVAHISRYETKLICLLGIGKRKQGR